VPTVDCFSRSTPRRKEPWAKQVEDHQMGHYMTLAPQAARGGEYDVRGYAAAYDSAAGRTISTPLR